MKRGLWFLRPRHVARVGRNGWRRGGYPGVSVDSPTRAGPDIGRNGMGAACRRMVTSVRSWQCRKDFGRNLPYPWAMAWEAWSPTWPMPGGDGEICGPMMGWGRLVVGPPDRFVGGDQMPSGRTVVNAARCSPLNRSSFICQFFALFCMSRSNSSSSGRLGANRVM